MQLYVVGAGIAFAAVNASVTQWFSQRLPREHTHGVALGTAISVFSMAAGPWLAWIPAPFAMSVGFMLLAGIEMGPAGLVHEAGGVDVA